MDDDRISTCERLVDALDDYLDGRTDAAERATVDAHLRTCEACAALAADVRTLRTAARTLEAIEPPAHVWHAVRARIAADAPTRLSLLERLGLRPGQPVYQPLAAAAGLVLVVASLTWVGVRLTQAPDGRTAAAAVPQVEFELAAAEYTDAIERLEEAAASSEPRLDAITSDTLQA